MHHENTVWLRIAGLVAILAGALAAFAEPDTNQNLEKAILVTPPTATGPEQKAFSLLLDEVEVRTGIRWIQTHTWPTDTSPVIAVGTASAIHDFVGPHAAAFESNPSADQKEGFRIQTFSGTPSAVIVVGNDSRGVLFGVGRLLQELYMSRGTIQLPKPLNLTTAPACPLRGHQLGYRPKTNSYDAWTPAMWEQYIRDLAIFGTNAIELLPPRTDDAADSPHFPLPPLEMLKRMSQIGDDYGLDVWLWYPALDKDYDNPTTVETALKEWDAVFAEVPRIDNVNVPGGDPGHTQPKYMMPLLEKAAAVLHRTHPDAKMWMSPQGFTKEWMDEFLTLIQTQQPTWLSGIVFGPQIRMTLNDLRKAIPPQYPIRFYPDITHTMQCQFPVPNWDHAFALTEQRECINPRPTQYAHIFQLFNPYTVGFLSYSEGCNDDINKFVWSGLGWEPNAPVADILQRYSRYFIGAPYADAFTKGILALEQNWTGPLLANPGVMTTLAQFQELERTVTPAVKLNWRFQQALYRAYSDAYTYRRLAYESELEQEAMDTLRQAERLGPERAMEQANHILDRAVLEPVAQDLRARIFELGEALYQSIRMQLSVTKYQAIHVDRGATLDLIDQPLNDRTWLQTQFADIHKMDKPEEQLLALNGLVNWTNPGPGGFYDDLGSLTQAPHLVRPTTEYMDPEYKTEPIKARDFDPLFKNSWRRYAETRYETPLQVHYTGLDPDAQYKVRTIYAGDTMEHQIRLTANEQEVHSFIEKPYPPKPLEFDIPKEITADGQLTLSWTQEPGRGGNGRGCQVAEVWLIKKTATTAP